MYIIIVVHRKSLEICDYAIYTSLCVIKQNFFSKFYKSIESWPSYPNCLSHKYMQHQLVRNIDVYNVLFKIIFCYKLMFQFLKEKVTSNGKRKTI